MIIVLLALITGVILGRFANQRVLRSNDRVFGWLSTILVALMGLSLGLNRAVFNDTGTILISSIVLATTASIGSILFVGLFIKLVRK